MTFSGVHVLQRTGADMDDLPAEYQSDFNDVGTALLCYGATVLCVLASIGCAVRALLLL